MHASGFSGSGRETGNREKEESRGRERGRGKKFTGIKGNFVLYSIFDVVTDNRVVSSDC